MMLVTATKLHKVFTSRSCNVGRSGGNYTVSDKEGFMLFIDEKKELCMRCYPEGWAWRDSSYN